MLVTAAAGVTAVAASTVLDTRHKEMKKPAPEELMVHD